VRHLESPSISNDSNSIVDYLDRLTVCFAGDSGSLHASKSDLRYICSLSASERFLIALRRTVMYLHVTNISSKRKRSLIRLIFWLKFTLIQYHPYWRMCLLDHVGPLDIVLSEPQSRIIDFLRVNELYSLTLLSKQYDDSQDDDNSIKHGQANKFIWHDRDDYRKYAIQDSGSRVIVSIHMGNILQALNLLSELTCGNRRVISLRHVGTITKQIITVGDLSSVSTDICSNVDSLSIVSDLRAGNCTLVAMYDLKSSSGETVEVDFFGRKARFVKGPAQLALMGRAIILPVVCYEKGGEDYLQTYQPIKCEILPGESLNLAVKRVTQILVYPVKRSVTYQAFDVHA